MVTSKLEKLRSKIDKLDDDIHDLIMQRWEVVKEIQVVKGLADIKNTDTPLLNLSKINKKLPIRPERESIMLKRLLSRHQGPFPLTALVQIWHEIIGAYTQLQQNFTVSVTLSDPQMLLWDLCRDQFGVQTPLLSFHTVRDTFGALYEGESQLAVIPFPEGGILEEQVWDQLLSDQGPNLIMMLPFMKNQVYSQRVNQGSVMPSAMVFALADPVPSGEDSSIFIFILKDQVSRSSFLNRLNDYFKSIETIKSTKADIIAIGPNHQLMVLVDDFIPSEVHQSLGNQFSKYLDGFNYVGAFPDPYRVKQSEENM